ncbi:hypothetical protein QYE76_006886 [Lolium multiflorum]|uniref:Cytochrome P450 n=1 Tax=Lolium multiflorum TaxID=4521 RepID=A0AAD8RVQ3_LOLMU|nr:hypothetical protein QYE76_006886 [Lolium multiflorum]
MEGLVRLLYALRRVLAVSIGGGDHGTWPHHRGVSLPCVELGRDEDDGVSSPLSARGGTRAGLGRGAGLPHGLLLGCGGLIALIPLLYATIRFLRARRRGSASASHGRPRLPPGPWHLPVIGSLHHLIGALPHRTLRDLSRRHGPLMLLRLGEVPVIVASSAEAAREVMKTQDQVLCTRPLTSCAEVLNQRGHGITFAPHGDRWRQLRKACVHALLNAKCVRSFRRIREEAAARFIRSITSSSFESQEAVNLRRMIAEYGADTTVHSVMGARFKEQDALLHYVDEAVRVVGCLTVSDLFPSWRLLRVLSGTLRRAAAFRDSSLAFMERFIVEHLERRASLHLPMPEEDDVIQESLRLHAIGPLLLPRECQEPCTILGYDVPRGTVVIVNNWAISRDPKYWDQPETFIPDRFMGSTTNYKGTNFEFTPFGAGRRICPGMLFGLANVELGLASLLFYFD